MKTHRGSHQLPRFLTSLTIALLAFSLLPAWNWSAPAAFAAVAEPARIRVVHAVPDAGAVDVYIDNKKVLSGVTFFTVGGYLEIAPGTYKVQVVQAGKQPSHATSLFEGRLSFAAGKDYSVVARGTAATVDASAVGGTLLTDDNAAPPVGQARLRVAHFAPDAPAVDIYANGAKVVSALSYTTVSGYLTVPPGSYTIGVAPAGGAVIYTTTATLAAGQVATAWANGLLAGAGSQAFKVTPSIDARFTETARIRAVHAVPDLAGNPVDVYLNDTKVTTFDFFTATDYVEVYAGSYTLRVVLAGGNPDTDAAIKASITLAPGQDYSAVARGTLDANDQAALGAALLTDDNAAPPVGQARLRVAHFAPDAPAVDIYANGAKVVSALSYTTVSGYLTVPPGSYTIGVAPAGGAVIYTTTATLAAGQVATAWANGLLAGAGSQAFKVTPTVDRAATTTTGERGRLRVLHASPDAPSVDVFVGDERVAAGLAFGAISAYLPVNAGTIAVTLKVAGSETIVYSNTLTITAGEDYTVAATGSVGAATRQKAALNVVVIEDDNTAPQGGQSKLRFVHLAPNAPSVDVRVGSRVLFDDVSYTTGGGSYVTAQPGMVMASVTSADGAQALLRANVLLAPDGVATVFAIGLAGNVPPSQQLRALAVNDLTAGTAQGALLFLPGLGR